MAKTFVHTIGGYYRDQDTFIKEAREAGVNRRIAVHLLKNISFGDVVVVLDWRAPVRGRKVRTVGKKGLEVPATVIAYGQFIVERLSFQAEVMSRLAKAMIEEGQVEVREGGGVVERECGSYVDGGGLILHPDNPNTLQDLLARAKAIAADMGIAKLETFIGGRFQAFQEPLEVERPPFQMGFWEVEFKAKAKRGKDQREVSGIGSYYLRDTAKRGDPLLTSPAETAPA